MTITKDTIVVKMPYPIRVGRFSISLDKKVGFTFTNLTIFFFRQNIGVETNKQLQDWHKENGHAKFMFETLWAAYEAYCALNYKKVKLDKEHFILAFSALTEDKKEQVLKVMQQAQDFGLKQPPGSKKKVTRKRK